MKKTILTPNAPAPIGPYSQAILVDNTLYCSGQIPINPTTNEIVQGTIKEQTHQCINNIVNVLKQAGMTFDNVIKTTCFLANMSDFTEFNEVYAQYFISKPARSCIAVKELPKSSLVEIEVIAKK